MAAPVKKSSPVIPQFGRARPDFAGEEDVALALPPTSAPAAAAATKTAPSLDGKPPVWSLIGAGGSGKTTLARWLAWRAGEEGRTPMLAALDPTNRTLAAFFEGVGQPDTSDGLQTSRWLAEAMEWLQNNPMPAVFDMGGGDTAFSRLLEKLPGFAEAMEEAGVPIVAAYLLTPRVDDLSALESFEGRGFQPKATALVLNEARVELGTSRDDTFARVLRHGAFRRAVDRGAVVLWLPPLEQDVALEIEAKRLQWHHARDGLVPEGKTFAPIGGLRRSMVRRWLERMESEFAPIRSWLP